MKSVILDKDVKIWCLTFWILICVILDIVDF